MAAAPPGPKVILSLVFNQEKKIFQKSQREGIYLYLISQDAEPGPNARPSAGQGSEMILTA